MAAKKAVPEDRRIDFMPLEDLLFAKAKRNPRDHDLGELTQSIERFGFVEPLALDERTERLVGGHGRLEALSQLKAKGIRPPAGVKADKADWLVPVLRGWSSKNDRDAEAFLLALNRIGERGGWRDDLLAEVLRDLAKDPEDLIGTGYDTDDLDEMLADLGEGPPPPDRDAVAKEPDVYEGDVVELGKFRLKVAEQSLFDSMEAAAGIDGVANPKLAKAIVKAFAKAKVKPG